MNALGRWLFGVKDAPVAALPTSPAQPILCECGSDQPMASVVLLRSYALRSGKLESEVTGERVCCQVCGNTFSIGPHGRFRQHPQALPMTPSGMPVPAPQRGMDPASEAAQLPPERAPILPTPLRAPRV